MNRVRLGLVWLLRNEDGADATEYALLGALIAVVIVGGASQLAGALNGVFTKMSAELSTVPGW